MNSNDVTSEFYDIVTSPLKSKEVTDEEISLINRFVLPNSTILDIGAGTGRHSLPLAKLGFKMVALDSSSKMLKLISKSKQNNIKVINKSIFKFIPRHKFDLIILFWNTFNEIALTKHTAKELLRKIKFILKQEGKIIINIDNSKIVNPQSFNFHTETSKDGLNLRMSWNTYKYYKRTNTAISLESIEVYKDSKLIDKKETYITQRYWRLNEIEKILKELSLDYYQIKLNTSDELYLVIFKKI